MGPGISRPGTSRRPPPGPVVVPRGHLPQ